MTDAEIECLAMLIRTNTEDLLIVAQRVTRSALAAATKVMIERPLTFDQSTLQSALDAYSAALAMERHAEAVAVDARSVADSLQREVAARMLEQGACRH